MKKIILCLLSLMFIGVFFCGCSSSVKTNEDGTPDLTGSWVEKGGEEKTAYQAACISDDFIEIYWIMNEDGEKSAYLYWAGTYEPPDGAKNSFKWESVNDKDRVSLFSSSDDTKEFTYKNGKISYDVTFQGETRRYTIVPSETDYSGYFRGKSTQNTTEQTTEAKVTETTTEVTTTENTYEKNEYYDVVDTASYVNSIGTVYLIHKVLAKKNVSAEATLIAYAPDGSVIGKSSDDIVLTVGQYNYFEYSFNSDISNASIQVHVQTESDEYSAIDRKAVEMVQYNRNDDHLYVTLKQTADTVTDFARFKLLYYKNGKIVGSESGYIDIYAENLNGKDSTDVVDIGVYGEDFDKVEYIYEP